MEIMKIKWIDILGNAFRGSAGAIQATGVFMNTVKVLLEPTKPNTLVHARLLVNGVNVGNDSMMDAVSFSFSVDLSEGDSVDVGVTNERGGIKSNEIFGHAEVPVFGPDDPVIIEVIIS